MSFIRKDKMPILFLVLAFAIFIILKQKSPSIKGGVIEFVLRKVAFRDTINIPRLGVGI